MIAETLPDVRSLPLSEKFELAAELWDEVLQREAELNEPPALAALLEQRLEDYQNGRTQGRSWEEVRRSVQGTARP